MVIIPRRTLLATLLLMQAIQVGLCVLAFVIIPQLREIYEDMGMVLPLLVRLILGGGYWLCLIFPLLLIGLSCWACRSDKPSIAPAFVMLATVLVTLVLTLLLMIFYFMAMSGFHGLPGI